MVEKDYKICFCRNCAATVPETASGCESCGEPRIVRHDEITALSIAHVDCDAFYASVEKRDAPELIDQPVIVGGGQRGVVTTACYIARTYGVRSAMPMFKALRACPDAVVVRPNFEKYTAVSKQVRQMMRDLTPLVEPLSIDEAFLDLGGTTRLHDAYPAQSLIRLQNRVKAELGITISVGLSHNKFLAKVASDLEKPDGFTIIGEAETLNFLASLPVTRIWGVGAAFAKTLENDGITMVGQLQQKDAADLMRRYGAMGKRLADLSRGRDTRTVTPSRGAKSVSAETTFNDDVGDVDTLLARLWPLCEKVSARMKQNDLEGRVVTLKLKSSEFQTITKRITLEDPSNLARALFDAASPLLRSAIRYGETYRLIGVGFSDLLPAAMRNQNELFERKEDRWARQENAIDAIREKFGDSSIGSGRAMKRGAKNSHGINFPTKDDL